MVEKLGIDRSKIDDLSNLLYKNYGTTMAGLRVCFFIYVTYLYIFVTLLDFITIITLKLILNIFYVQAIGYDFDYDEYHRYTTYSSFLN